LGSGFEVEVEERAVSGTGGSRRLRRSGRVPAVIYGGGQPPRTVTLDHMALLRHMEREAFYTSILSLKRGAETEPVIIKDVQRHPAKTQVLHLDFQRIVEDQEITLHVPIHFLGEETAKGVKDQGGVLEHLMTDVEVNCLPRYLPEFLSLDVSELELNQILHLSDIPLPEGVELVALAHGQDYPVVAINPPRREEEEVAAPAEGAAPEAAAPEGAPQEEAGKAGGEPAKE
jgi:large subunit ribosomal protein L25